MNKLKDDQLINIVRCPIITSKGAGTNFYSLTTKAKYYLTLKNQKPTASPTSTSLLHHFTINTFINGFQILKNDDVEIVTLTAKQLMYKNEFYNHVKNSIKTKIIIPDFFILLKAFGEVQAYFGEVDTSTEAIYSTSHSSDIKTKFRIIESYRYNEILKFFDTNLTDFDYLHITAGNNNRITQIQNVASDNTFITSINDILPIIKDKRIARPSVDYSPIFNKVWIKPNSNERFSIS